MKRLIFIFFVVCFASGCAGTGKNKVKEETTYSGKKIKNVRLILTQNYLNDTSKIEIPLDLKDNTEFENIFKKECIPKTPSDEFILKMAPLDLAISYLVVGAIKMGFDLYMDKKMARLERTKKAAQRPYSANILLPSYKLNNCNCAVFIRKTEEEKKENKQTKGKNGDLGLVVLAKINSLGNGFSFQPIYVKAYNSIAITNENQKLQDNEKPHIDLSIGFSVKAIGTQASKLPGLYPVGEAAVSVNELNIGKDSKASTCDGECPASDLIPFASDDNSAVSVTMSIVETGDVGINFDQKKAELLAIKEALGPAMKDAFLKYFDKKYEEDNK